MDNSLEDYSIIQLSCITIAAQGDIFNQYYYKNNYKFLRNAHHLPENLY